MRTGAQPIKKRYAFTPEEDDKLRSLVNKYGVDNWSRIAMKMKKRSVRQCRDRWFYYLSPAAVNGKWSDAEDAILKEKVDIFGKKWKFITQFFNGRTDINIKNRWNYLKKQEMKSQMLAKEKNNKISGQQPQAQNQSSLFNPNNDTEEFHMTDFDFDETFDFIPKQQMIELFGTNNDFFGFDNQNMDKSKNFEAELEEFINSIELINVMDSQAQFDSL